MPGHTDSHGGPNKPGPSGFGRDPDTKGGDGPNRQPGLFGSPGAAGSVGFTGTTVGAGPQFGGGSGGSGGQSLEFKFPNIIVNDIASEPTLAAYLQNIINPPPLTDLAAYGLSGGEEDQAMSEALASAAPEVVEETPQQTTNSIIEALFNKNLTFQYDPVADYVNRLYGGLRPDQRKRLLAKGGYEGEFDDFLDDFGQDIYDASNFQLSDLRNLFTPKPKVETPPLTGQEIAGKVIGGGLEAVLAGATLPYTNAPLAFMSGNIPGMFLSLAFGEGPYQMDEDGKIIGDVANLQNAPQDYLNAVQAANILTPENALYQTGVNFTPEQVAQISMGEQLRAEEQAATRGPSEVYQTPSLQTISQTPIQAQPAGGQLPEDADLQAIYNNLSSAEQDTVDTMMSFDEGYDLGYALRYVLGGNPLF